LDWAHHQVSTIMQYTAVSDYQDNYIG